MQPKPPKPSLAGWLASQPPETQAEWLETIAPTKAQREALRYSWAFWGRPDQHIPPGDWIVWLILAGRGWGKSRTGAETVRTWVDSGEYGRIALVGRTAADVRDVMIEGESGLLVISPKQSRPKWYPSRRRLVWPNGAQATTYSADEPDQLRGPQQDAAWADEVAAWESPDALAQLRFGLRLGPRPRLVATTTPRPTKPIRELIKESTTIVTRGRTSDNSANLAPAFLSKIVGLYKDTRLGRQELDGEVLDDSPGALWNRDRIDSLRVRRNTLPELIRVVVAIDPAVTTGEDSDETGIVVVGLGEDKHLYILDDASGKHHAHDWPRIAKQLYAVHQADSIVAEVNNGGDLVEEVIRNIDPELPVKKVHATRGKVTRAQPGATIYERGTAHHAGTFAALEDQLCTWEPGQKSPDRLDALVWAITELTQPTANIGFSLAS